MLPRIEDTTSHGKCNIIAVHRKKETRTSFGAGDSEVYKFNNKELTNTTAQQAEAPSVWVWENSSGLLACSLFLCP